MGFGHRVYRAEDPRARVLRRTARELGSPRFEVAEALEQAALAELTPQARPRPGDERRVLEAVVLDTAEVPADLFTPMFACSRFAGWSAHVLEQKRQARLHPAHRQVRRARPGRSPRSRAEPAAA